MHGFEQDLRTSAYDLQDMYGKRLFTEKVLWGEVWIADRTSKETWWAGYIRDGELYLDQSSRNRFLYNRKHTRQIPSLLPVGNYKIWLDAWVRQGDYAYVGDAFFTKDGLHDLAWSAPPVPQRKHWQDIEVRPPKEPGEPHRISVRSRRFHWVYRVSRLIDTLDQLLHPHEYMIANVANVRRDAAYLREFLGVLYQSGTNMNKIETRRTIQGQDEWGQMQMTLLAVMNRCENFIAFGWGGVGSKAEESALRERQHINNVAHLLWRLINNEHFAKDVEFYEEAFAAEHRVILSRLGAVFNRVPRAVASVSPWLDSRNNFVDRPHHLSIPYGEKFAKQLTLPYFNYKAEEDGGTPPFKSASKPASAVKWLNSTRRYGISMLNAASIWVSTKEVNWEHMRKLLEKQAELIAQSDLILRSRYPDTFKLMDKLTDRVLERARSLGRLTARLEKEALHQRQELAGKLRGADPEMDGELKKFDQSLQGIADEIETREPQKMLDALKKSNPNVVYGVEAFEICVKWVVMWSTWNAFWQAYKENGGLRKETAPKMADSLLKTADFASSVLRSAGFARILQASWMNKIASTVSEEQILRIQKWGKGLSAVADVGSAVLYTYEVFS
ncbi:MAG: hypothetical protein ACRDTR_22010, partial [Rubrobacter sp.]